MGGVEGSDDASPLSVRSGHARFRASGSRLSWLAHVDIVMTALMYNHQVLTSPVVMIAINMVKVYPLVIEKLGFTMSACMALFSKQTGCNPVVEFGVSRTPVHDVTVIG